MFYENTEFHVASLHSLHKNSNAFAAKQTERKRSVINIVLLGDRHVGKSKLIEQWTKTGFRSEHHALDALYQPSHRSSEREVRFKFYPIHLTYRSDDNSFISRCRFADCLLLVYDISSQISFDHVLDRCLPLMKDDRNAHRRFCSFVAINHGTSRQMTAQQVELLVSKHRLSHYEVALHGDDEGFLKELLDRYFRT